MPVNVEDAIEQLLTIHYRSAEDTLKFSLLALSSYQQSCDVILRAREPLLDVKVDKSIADANESGADRKQSNACFKTSGFPTDREPV